ncbi:hypothetical protein THASP1DRAFT_28222 [Thamnocephalis sphaerospora]|uniref:Questin oxidase family protein n=1 Tax=Thamnocephalis sphaerospora TaxID=78915 RepID=A0A4P9XUU9_9FUNG|nr:hypothetical protein THASP1DRAFT_28222 [Thamnocephalis sphaerospora]|eukprot:RKP09996.1 hypothetical protein THASP1DRAFT_28222 [Thamnocephalis sphaerospora]
MTTSNVDERHAVLAELLRRNHDGFDVRYGTCYTNHTVHTLYALADLGADQECLRRFYGARRDRLRKQIPPKLTITDENWDRHFGDPANYSAYLVYFDAKVEKLGLDDAFNRYVPKVLAGILGAVGHPLIHLGFALGHRDPMVLAEALAFACAAEKSTIGMADAEYRGVGKRGDIILHIKEALADITNDVRLDPFAWQSDQIMDILIPLYEQHGPVVAEYFNRVAIEEGEPLVDQLVRLATEVFIDAARDGLFDFFLVHAITTAHALHIIAPRLDNSDLARLLRGYWLYLLMVYICQGRPPLVHFGPIPDAPSWAQITKSVMADEDEHTPKLVVTWREAAKREQAASHGDDVWWRSVAAAVVTTIHQEKQWNFRGIGKTLPSLHASL